MRRPGDLQTTAEKQPRFTDTGVIDDPVFLPDQQHLRWSRIKTLDDAQEMYDVVSNEVFSFLRTLGGDDATYSHHMANARFTIPAPQLLDRVVQLVDDIPLQNRDTNGDLYEYLLSELSPAGQNGRFRTPRHIVQLAIETTVPILEDRICAPACGPAGEASGDGRGQAGRVRGMVIRSLGTALEASRIGCHLIERRSPISAVAVPWTTGRSCAHRRGGRPVAGRAAPGR